LAFHSGREADRSPPSSAEVKEWVELYLYSPNAPSWLGAQLGGAQGQLYIFYLTFHLHYGIMELCIMELPGNCLYTKVSNLLSTIDKTRKYVTI
jgi:hypothetical protein